ncbi:hypothetical protein PHLGIDRAFT_491613 [Phlebiopsis gigantea 11061_1 CR5-6]|uniref:Xylanolytic transcriptional activator regulatory domain-containing protein n=1 Tax=Phlebiopsis gigantea (strain 11061_1 CR5-6) TaxID=745531 RepID=A0A0C3S4I8_PHLG1|nr:hypothetical protein PHLGIDRAFT_491613 [Phlebiopsis gigantea 11061_1 CR5-6]
MAFPNAFLMGKLVQEYFVRMNDIYPLLHRPTFEYGISIGLHLKDEGFGSTVLLVCALGSRFVDDEGVLPQGIKSWHWAGWHWFQHVNSSRRFVHTFAPRVYDLQICFLFAMFVANSPVPHAIYSVIGHGLRLATDMGAHRRIAYGARPTIEDELKKRALWCLFVNDRSMCDKFGRPYNIDDEDLEVGLPAECDDEYWIVDGQDVAFAHPPGTQSKIAAFNCMIRFSRIHAEGFRTLYDSTIPIRSNCIPTPNAHRVVSELDPKLNEFIDSIPEYLRWCPHRNNSVFTNQ